jgi:DNA polymerase-3 subunit alpha (Gram-positive type)
MGNIAAESIYNAAQEKPFSSIEDLKKRAKIGNAGIELLKKFGCLEGIPESNQMSFFDMM